MSVSAWKMGLPRHVHALWAYPDLSLPRAPAQGPFCDGKPEQFNDCVVTAIGQLNLQKIYNKNQRVLIN